METGVAEGANAAAGGRVVETGVGTTQAERIKTRLIARMRALRNMAGL